MRRASRRRWPPMRLLTVFRWMADDLERNDLVVSLVPAPEPNHVGHCIRVVESRNPEWYRQLCQRHTSHRSPHHRPRTKWRKRDAIRLCRRLAAGRGTCSAYLDDLIAAAESLLDEWDRERDEQLGEPTND